jgi:hypothetical protein
VGYADSVVRLWLTTTGELLGALEAHTQPIFSLTMMKASSSCGRTQTESLGYPAHAVTLLLTEKLLPSPCPRPLPYCAGPNTGGRQR